jgi:hypothetical protein
LTGYNDKAIDVNLLKSILRTFQSSNFVLSLNMILLESDYYTSNFVQEEIRDFLEYKDEMNPSLNKQLLNRLINTFSKDELEYKVQTKSVEIAKIADEILGNEKVSKYLELFDKKLSNLKDMNEEINKYIRGCEVVQNKSAFIGYLNEIIGKNTNYLGRLVTNLNDHINLEGANLNKIIDQGLKKLEDFNSFKIEIQDLLKSRGK